MTAQSVAGVPLHGRRDGRRLPRAARAIIRRPALAAATVGSLVALMALAILLVARVHAVPAASATEGTSVQRGSPWPAPAPFIRSAELWFATTPAAGVWADLKVIVDNPLSAEQSPAKTVLLVSGTLLEDFKIRSAEPKLLHQPQRRTDGRYALVFPAPIPESLNWLRVSLEARQRSPRPLSLTLLPPASVAGHSVSEQPPLPVQVFYSDRQADPFVRVPEPLVSWVPGQAQSALPVLVVYAAAIGCLAAAGCAAAFWVVRR